MGSDCISSWSLLIFLLKPPNILYWPFQSGTSVMVPYCSCCLCLYFGSSIMLVTYFVNFRLLNDHLFGKELFILFAASAFRKLSSIYVFSYFPFGFEGRIWDMIVSIPDHCLSFYFPLTYNGKSENWDLLLSHYRYFDQCLLSGPPPSISF